jgi:membrane associated rhomboid family serine protease
MYETVPICTILIIVLTVFCSFIGFRDPAFTEKFIFSPLEILAFKKYYRMVTSAFLHADLNHLLNNMVTLWFFGRGLEMILGPVKFLVIYFGAIVGGNLLSLWLHRQHEYRAYGASGGVCGVVFSYITLNPNGTLFAHFIIPMPAWAYGILFLIGSYLALRRGRDNIGHDAHIGGAALGLWITGAFEPRAIQMHWIWFAVLSAISLALFLYFFKNPMMLPMSSIGFSLPRFKKERRAAAPPRNEAREVDAVLEKISQKGVQSLTDEERALLNRVSNKFQNRAKSEKPKSDLII